MSRIDLSDDFDSIKAFYSVYQPLAFQLDIPNLPPPPLWIPSVPIPINTAIQTFFLPPPPPPYFINNNPTTSL